MKKLRNKADRLLQQHWTQKRPKCEICGKPASCQHHFHPKSSSSALRYVDDNLISVCVGCHLGFHSNRSAQFASIIIAKRGVEWSNKLLKQKYAIVKPTVAYYKSVIARFTGEDECENKSPTKKARHSRPAQ